MNEPILEWSEALALGQTSMDDTHREFVALLNRVAAADAAGLLASIDEFTAHTETHFEQEERWMSACAFPPLHCHKGEHAKVLETVVEVRRRVAAGDMELGRKLAEALAEWFPQHAQSMDAMLAQFMRQTGYVPGHTNDAVPAPMHAPAAGCGCSAPITKDA